MKPTEEVSSAQSSEQVVKEPKPLIVKPTARSRPGDSLPPRNQSKSPTIDREATPSTVKIQSRTTGETLEKAPISDVPRTSLSPVPRPNPTETESNIRSAPSPSPIKSYAPLYHLLGEFSQFQLSFPSELKPLLTGSEEWFPVSNPNANPSVQGEVLVIGVLGTPGSGKSSLLNSIASHCSPLVTSHPSATTDSVSMRPLSILQQLATLDEKDASTELATSKSSNGPFPEQKRPNTSKSLIPTSKAFSIDMAILQRPNYRLFDSIPNSSLKRRVNEADCVILLEAQSLLQAPMLVPSKRSDSVAVDVRNQDTTLQLLSLQIGIFLLSVCNIVLAVDDSTCSPGLWKHLKTLEMLKWTFPEVSDLFHSAPSISLLIPQLKQSFLDARRRETYEKIMLDVVSKSAGQGEKSKAGRIASVASADGANASPGASGGKKRRRGNKKNAGANEKNMLSKSDRSLAADLTIDEKKVNEISGALDAINLYSAEQEYLPALMFVFNKVNPSAAAPAHQSRIQKSLSAFFARSSLLSPVPCLENAAEATEIPNPAQSLNPPSIDSIPFTIVPGVPHYTKASTPSFDAFVQKVFELPAPRFRKPLNPREWIISSSWMWELIRQSQVLSNYHTALRSAKEQLDPQSSSSKHLKEAVTS